MENSTVLIWMIIFASYLGFCIENCFVAVRHGYIDTRGGYLPALIGYGILIAAMYLLFGTPQNPALFGRSLSFESRLVSDFFYIMLAFIIVSVGELLLGTVIEKTCNMVWWDYTSLPLHFTKFTSVPTSAAFSLLIYTYMSRVYPAIFYFTERRPAVSRISGFLILLLMIADYLHSTWYMYKHHKTLVVYRQKVDVFGLVKERFERFRIV